MIRRMKTWRGWNGTEWPPWPKGHHDCLDHLSVLQRLLPDTNLFDVIASLGTGLYVHHIELSSFPLCRLNRNLPATVPGRGGGGSECGVEGNKQNKTKKIQNDTERTEQWRQQKGSTKKQGRTHIQSNHKKFNIEIKVLKSLIKRLEYAEIPRDGKNWMKWTEGEMWDSRLWQSLRPLMLDASHFLNVSFSSSSFFQLLPIRWAYKWQHAAP